MAYVLLKQSISEIVIRCVYTHAESMFISGYALLPYTMQPKGFDRVLFESHIKAGTYPIWMQKPLPERIFKAIKSKTPITEQATISFISHTKKLSSESIFLRPFPLLLGFTIRDLIALIFKGFNSIDF